MNLGHVEAHEKLTARLFYKPTGQAGYTDAGNVKEYADATTRSLVTHMRAEDGFRVVNDEQVNEEHPAFTFLLTERDVPQEKLISLARRETDVTQSFNEGVTATLEAVAVSQWFAIGAYNIENVAVTASESGALVEGTDYQIDKENGRLFVEPSAGVSDGEDLTVTFDQGAVTFERYTSQKTPLFQGNFIIEEHNQYSQVFLRRLTFTGTINVIEFPSQTGEFATCRVKVTPNSVVTIDKRPAASTLSAPTYTAEGAAMSSSSSSNSSSSSESSSSSSSS